MKTLLYSFKKTLPILCGYLFLGFAFGVLMLESGYSWVWSLAASIFVYAGSMQFVLVSFLASGAPFATVALMTLLVNGRHIFYGLSLIDRYRTAGKWMPYLVFSLTDETYSLLCADTHPADIDPHRADVLISVLNHSYWIAGSLLGAIVGELLPIDFTGIDFSMTALFIVLLIEQCKSFRSYVPVVSGAVCALGCLLLFGAEQFLLPTLGLTVAILLTSRRTIERQLRKGGEAA